MLNATVSATPPVYQGVWRDYGLPTHRSLVLTVGNWSGAAILVIFVPLLAWIQERCWRIIRHIGIKIWNPLRLADEDNPYDLERLTQIGAILSIRRIKYKGHSVKPNASSTETEPPSTRTEPPSTGTEPLSTRTEPPSTRIGLLSTEAGPSSARTESPATRTEPSPTEIEPPSTEILTVPVLFQVAAAINLTVFIAIGLLAPIVLTGQFRTPTVLSRDTDTCIGFEDRIENKLYTAQLADNYYKQCLHGETQSSFCSQESGVVGIAPKLYITRDDQCPFAGNVCQDDVRPLQLEHRGLSPRDFGVNLAANVLVDHRVTCAPLKTEEFILFLSPN